MKDLIERLEKCDGPDRVLDGMIFKAIAEKPGDVWADDFDDGVWHRQDPEYRVAFDPPPYYTASIDVALALVPEGWWLTGCGEQRTQIIYVKDRHEPTGFFYAKVQHIKGGRLQVASARSIAIALCVASLRARMK